MAKESACAAWAGPGAAGTKEIPGFVRSACHGVKVSYDEVHISHQTTSMRTASASPPSGRLLSTLLALFLSTTDALLTSCASTTTMPRRAVHLNAQARVPTLVMMGKKTSWSIGKERKKAKRGKSSKPTAASVRTGASSGKGFQVTKEKCVAARATLKLQARPSPHEHVSLRCARVLGVRVAAGSQRRWAR